jgi:penicillin-binding protein 1C
LYVPQNYDHEFRGSVSVRTALSSSLNVPAVRALMLVGPEAFVDRLRSLGFEGLVESGDHYGYSLALGSAEVSLWQLTNAYRAFANGGVWSPARWQPGPAPKAVRVADPAAAWVVSDILSDRGARSVGFGLENPLATRFWSAVKTGTSKDMRDNWCVGFSRRYTVGVWVGNFDGSPMQDVSGVSGAAPAWLDIMQFLHAQEPRSGAPARPAEVVMQKVRYVPEIEPEREEWFLKGTEMSEVMVKPVRSGAGRIVYPANGVILAVDPDIPDAVQRVQFRATGAGAGAQWWLDGTALSETGPVVTWAPRSGRFELALVEADGSVLDRVRFEVRGTRKSP